MAGGNVSRRGRFGASRVRAALSIGATAAFAGLAGLRCGSSGGGGDSAPAVDLAVAFGGATFTAAVDLLQHPTDDARWYVVQQGGAVETFLAGDPLNSRTTTVLVAGLLVGGESGLLGMAFHPDFAATGEVFLSYVLDTGGPGTSVVGRFLSSDGGLTFVPDPGPDPIVLTQAQPFSNHNGGDLDFGPDGYLYVALGDGGGAGDPGGNAQDVGVWLGKVLRLDVDGARPYAIPPDNPFVGIAGADEIWAFGLRNPWRLSFDPVTGALWAGDVGQGTAEEIDVLVRGGNFGWNLQEGDRLYPSLVPGMLPGTIQPVAVHLHPDAQSITGGHVYRGMEIPALASDYVYGDFVTGRIFALDTLAASPSPREPLDTGLNISAFGRGRDGELYVVAYGSPEPIRKLVPIPEG